MRLTQKQIEWVYARCCKFCVKWYENPPKSEEEIKQFVVEARAICEASKQAKDLMTPLIVATLGYIDLNNEFKEETC